jgi:hypothetical protein
MAQQIVVTISPTGSVKIDAVGFKGGACEKATEQLHVVLGGGAQAGARKRKPDFFATTGQKSSQKLGR